MKDKKQEQAHGPATGKGKKKHLRRIKPGNMYFRWKADQIGGIPDGSQDIEKIELPDDYYQNLLKEYAKPWEPKDRDAEVEGLNAHIRELKELVGKLETKIEKYEKRDNDSQSGDVCTADHR